MHTGSLIPLAALLAYADAAKQLQINYYGDRWCSSYQGQVDVSWADQMGHSGGNCYNFQYGTSVNIASCNEGYCMCEFFGSTNCANGYSSVVSGHSGDGNCIHDSQSYRSFRCYVY
ncbi:hypothetical protein NKR23_g10179 [Pleurostoma richardsiae]|uniref:Uncharacterized protein n=1 Tax=Pleurostoma richardsiae TaxID=41990 RepID=A0AA38R5F0_9PEZI|nr:hypothetical protein NKR23_g10179 [Pleurostoma richardsiae]